MGGHQWGLSWRDHPPPARRHPQASPLLSLYNTEICLCATQKLSLCNREIVSVLQRAHCFWAEIGQKSRIGQNWSPCHRFEVCGYGGASHGPQEAIGTIFGPKKRSTKFLFALPAGGQPFRAVYTGPFDGTVLFLVPPSRGIAILGGWVDTSGV